MAKTSVILTAAVDEPCMDVQTGAGKAKTEEAQKQHLASEKEQKLTRMSIRTATTSPSSAVFREGERASARLG